VNDRRLIGMGVAGVVAATLCCATPVAVVVLGVLGLSSFMGWIDPVSLAVASGSAGLVAYGVYRRRTAARVADGGCDSAKAGTRASR
jgi:mercuric ion transport protein